MKFLLGGKIVVYNDNAHIILFKYMSSAHVCIQNLNISSFF